MSTPALLIAGPTASGKSALALRLAERAGALVMNADSMQVYADLRVLTARPSVAEEARAPHRLYGHVDAARRYSTAAWLEAAAAVMADARAADRPIIVVGGTGLYFKALIEGLSPIPQPTETARQRVAALFADAGVEGLRAAAEEIDPDAAQRILGRDRQRLVRLLEVAWGTEKTLSQWRQAQKPAALSPAAWRGLVIEADTPALDARIAMRAEAMLNDAGAAEVRALLARQLDPDLPAMKAIGVAATAAMLAGEATRAATLARIVLDTRRYAKRQRTWFRNQMADWPRIGGDDAAGAGAIWSAPNPAREPASGKAGEAG